MLFSLLPGATWSSSLTVRKVTLIGSLSQAHSKYIVLFVLILMAIWQHDGVVIDVTHFRTVDL